MHTLLSTEVKTPIGNILAISSAKGICMLEFTDVTERLKKHSERIEKYNKLKISTGDSPYLKQLKKELEEYFSGMRQNFDVPLDYNGTDFQQHAWHALLNIPYGETRSYQEQAIAIKKPKAVRAVAGANNQNKIAILIPCHRVIGKNGSLTGYGGELWRKEFLLKLELNELNTFN